MTEFNLTPPEPEPTLTERLAALGITPTWDKTYRTWTLPGLMGVDPYPTIGYLMDEPEADEILTSRDRETVERIIDNTLDPEAIELDDDLWRDSLGYYSDHNDRGPSINVKLHDTYDFWRILEKALDLDFEEYVIDAEYVIWTDVVDGEMDWFTGDVLPRDYPDLDPKAFTRMGRSGGHLTYNIGSRPLTLAEADALRRLWEEIPDYVRGCAQEVVARQWAYALTDITWEKVVDEWRDGEMEAVADSVRTNDYAKAAWHQANLDAEIEWFGEEDAFNIVWGILYESDEE